MVRALLAGTKTQTRRALMRQPSDHYWSKVPGYELQRALLPALGDGRAAVRFSHSIPQNPSWDHDPYVMCPYGSAGELLWVRESWQFFDWTEDGEPIIRYAADLDTRLPVMAPDLTGTWAALSDPTNFSIHGRACDQRWRPSIHIPRWASRITLEVTEVRVERLQDISEVDAKAEGCDPLPWSGQPGPADLIDWPLKSVERPFANSYAVLWESINGYGSWAANPWIWAVSFKRVTE